MTKKGDRRNKKDPDSLGNKGSIMNGDDAGKSKGAAKPNIHERRTVQKNRK